MDSRNQPPQACSGCSLSTQKTSGKALRCGLGRTPPPRDARLLRPSSFLIVFLFTQRSCIWTPLKRIVAEHKPSLQRTLAPSLHRHTQLDGRFFTILSMYNSTYRFKAGWFLIFIMLGVSTSDSARWVTLSALKVSALRVLKTLRK